MIWARINYGELPKPKSADYHSARKPEEVADEVSKIALRREPEDRVIFLWHAGTAHGSEAEPALFPSDHRNNDAYTRGGFRAFTTQWMTRFWRRLAANNIKPSLTVLDYEDADGFWGLKTDYPRDRDLPDDMPDWAAVIVTAMRKVNSGVDRTALTIAPIDYIQQNGKWQLNRNAIVQFNNWQLPQRAAALRFSILKPAAEIYGEPIAASNFAEQERLWPGVDGNGWPMPKRAMTGNVSSPVTYLGSTGQRYSVDSAQKTLDFRRALNWVDVRNDVRSALAINKQVAPWYSNPDFGRDANESLLSHRLMWAAGLLHDRYLGVSTMLFWSANSWSTQEIEFARPVIAYLRTMRVGYVDSVAKLSEMDPQAELAAWTDLAKRVIAVAPPRLNAAK